MSTEALAEGPDLHESGMVATSATLGTHIYIYPDEFWAQQWLDDNPVT